MPRARAFYESVFQTKLEKLDSTEFEMWGFPMDMNGSGASGALIRLKGVASGGNSTLVYFTCADCAVEADRVIKHGGSLDRKKKSIGKYGYIALAVDTEGNLIGLHSMK